jgi:peptidoglycan-N-acetylglucosamine deacetylase
VLLQSFIVLTLLLVSVFILVVFLPHLYGRLSRVLLARRCRRAGAVVLTYDDGPGAILTPELVALLRNHAAKATFFCLGMKAASDPDIMDLLKSEGHEIACHSFRHCNPWKARPSVAMRDIGEGFDSLARWLSPQRWYRPPHGKITLHTWIALLARRAKIVWWTHDSGDTWKDCPAAVDGLVASVIRSGGGVVLLHDFDRENAEDAASRSGYVLSVTRSMIEQARQAGLKVMTLGDLFLASDGCLLTQRKGKCS